MAFGRHQRLAALGDVHRRRMCHRAEGFLQRNLRDRKSRRRFRRWSVLEAVTISILRDQRPVYNEPFNDFTFTKFDGITV